ncbi:uncharacterized protein si:ch73-347e22.8 [Engraulis encrasicolus]|uniref:uncharacterized protein si:ch73-347e22.8 n=1 Tax=Engraulis encrasicolus TaxID=184585 RepID=UPI002FD302F6
MKLWIHVTIALVSFMTVGGILFSQFHRLNHLPLEVEFAEQVLRARAFEAKETQIALDLNDRYQRSPLNKTVDDIRRKILELTASKTKWATEAEECQKTQKDLDAAIEERQQEKTTLEGEFNSLKTQWNEEMNKLEQQLGMPSPVCAFVIENDETKKLCSPQKDAVPEVIVQGT